MAVQKAKRAFDEAEAKLALVKKWNRNFANEVMPIAKQLEKLQSVFATNLPEAISYLGQAVRTLDSYSEVASMEVGRVTPVSADETSTPEGGAQGIDAPYPASEQSSDPMLKSPILTNKKEKP